MLYAVADTVQLEPSDFHFWIPAASSAT